MKRWEFLKKGDQYFFDGPASPMDFYVLIVDNKKLGALTRNTMAGDRWTLLINLEHHTGPPIKRLDNPELTVEEAKAEAEKILCVS